MADIAAELITYLKTQSGVTSLVGSGSSARIYNQDSPPQHVARTDSANTSLASTLCVTVQAIENMGHMGGRSSLNVADVMITSFAATPTARSALASAVYSALPPSLSSMGSVDVAEVFTQSRQVDSDALPYEGSDFRVYVATSAYRIWFYE